MTLSSMTGFARASGSHDGLNWQWEIRSVNGKGLDVRARVPLGFEALEGPVREAVARHVRRGNVQANLICEGPQRTSTITINEAVLEELLSIAERLRARIGGEPPRVDALLSLRGVLETATTGPEEAVVLARDAALLDGLTTALLALVAARASEGARLAAILEDQLRRIENLTVAARDCPARTPQAVRTRLAEQVARLLETGAALDPDRLHQEAVLIATRADIQEEIDRLFGHVEAARQLIASSEAAGRKLDFLAQEFNREANTLCSKASDRALTAIGLELKAVIDQLREQVANVE